MGNERPHRDRSPNFMCMHVFCESSDVMVTAVVVKSAASGTNRPVRVGNLMSELN